MTVLLALSVLLAAPCRRGQGQSPTHSEFNHA